MSVSDLYEKHKKLSRDYGKMWSELQEWTVVLKFKAMQQMSLDDLKLRLYSLSYARVRQIKQQYPTKDDLLRYFLHQVLMDRFPTLEIDRKDLSIEQVKSRIEELRTRLDFIRHIDIETVTAYNAVRETYAELKPIFFSEFESENDDDDDIAQWKQHSSVPYMKGYMAQLIPRWEEKIARLALLESRYVASTEKEEKKRIADEWDDERDTLNQLEAELRAVSTEIIEGDPGAMFTPLEWYDTRKGHDLPPWKHEELQKTVEWRRESVAYYESNLERLRAEPYDTKSAEWLRNRYTTAGGKKKLPKNTSLKRLQELARQEYAKDLQTQQKLLASSQEELSKAEESMADFVRQKQVDVKREEGESDAKARRLGLLICGNCNKQPKKPVTCGNSCGVFYCNQKCADAHWVKHSCKPL